MPNDFAIQNVKTPYLTISEQDEADVDNPDAGTQRIFIDSDDNTTKIKDSSGNIRELGGGSVDYILIREEQTQNTAGGEFASGAWRTRVLNTEVSDVGGHASLSSNQITLAAGTYECLVSCPAYAVNRHQARLQNITDASTILIGSSEFAGAVDNGMTRSMIAGRFTLASSKTIEVQHQCQTTKSINGFGSEANFTTEIYTVVEFRKVNS